MKLRNKKTGKIVELQVHHIAGECYESLADVNKDWEDYDEPKKSWHINDVGEICEVSKEALPEAVADAKAIGNYFETKEDAEKAVEKLKAWKRLKDNGFKFEGIEKRGHHINFYQGKSYETDKQCQQGIKDLYLLFGGEE